MFFIHSMQLLYFFNVVFLLVQSNLPLCGCFDYIPKREGSIPPSNVDGQLPEILAPCRCSLYLVNDLIPFRFLFCVGPSSSVALTRFQNAREVSDCLI